MKLITRQPAKYACPTTKAVALTHLIFERPDLDLAESYLKDFGLVVGEKRPGVTYFQDRSEKPYCYRVEKASKARFVGFGLQVASHDDLLALQAELKCGPIKDSTHPGGGKAIKLTDPSGFMVEVSCDQESVGKKPYRSPLPVNTSDNVERRNETQRPPVEPPQVLKLGHVVIEVAKFQETSAWYTKHFGFIPSDVQVLPDGSPAVCFFRLDLGDTPADHHTLAMAQGFMPLYSHSAYEVIDADAVGMGQRVLREKGWNHAWGIGRHILGSQIFDYWSDPWGDKHEHYCDGDAFTSDRALGVHPVSRDAMSQWGQPMPASFTKPKLSPKAVAELVKNLREAPDLSVKKLITLAKLFA
ncbi:MAG: VOC family protein [Gammaproteobacteria bacterium]|nr:VOC family protein [Gammaproteobacteria bacterium]